MTAAVNVQANPAELALVERIERNAVQLEAPVDYSKSIIPYKTKADGEHSDHVGSNRMVAALRVRARARSCHVAT